ncbi:hypothetical protein KKI93_18650 [Xenorhabdus bovienii]|uniref:hypothetical protein n=1 Tax=Xenorhabdus bovienii TaxID=40576 RepID=UPI0023B24B48|nr:hypothetical protein [Xenorhabdus bovienii]MDE9566021.1 hypothetical protein [Xenorhabdus bovienii]
MANVSVNDYFRYISGVSPLFIGPRISRFLSEHRRIDDNVLTLRIKGYKNIKDLKYPTDSNPNRSTIYRRLTVLGFSSITPDARNAANNIYQLRHHSFDISLDFYLHEILPFISSTIRPDLNIGAQGAFENRIRVLAQLIARGEKTTTPSYTHPSPSNIPNILSRNNNRNR